MLTVDDQLTNVKATKPMSSLIATMRRFIDDLRHGRNREAYALFLVGVILVVLGLIGVVHTQILLSAILLALSFLVFHTSIDMVHQKQSLDEVLLSRESFGAFSKLLSGVKDLRIYGPTAVNVLVSSGDIRKFILSSGGVVRVIVQDEDPGALVQTAAQLDDNLDLQRTLSSSLAILDKLATDPGFDYRKLPFNPGFSLVIVNAESRTGYLILEFHGFQDENIADRMHIVIKKNESEHWFSYWSGRFEAMWAAARQPPVPAN